MYIFYFVDVLKTIKDTSCLENVDHLNDNRHKNLNFLAADQKPCIFQIIYLLELYYLLYFANPFYNMIFQTIPSHLISWTRCKCYSLSLKNVYNYKILILLSSSKSKYGTFFNKDYASFYYAIKKKNDIAIFNIQLLHSTHFLQAKCSLF